MAKKNKTKAPKKLIKKAKQQRKGWLPKKPVLKILIKSSFMISMVVATIYYLDAKGYFNPEEANNHTKKKWNSFYDFTEENNVDVVLIGNSHLYSGINPINLSNTLGANCFILASPGTHVGDSYFCLVEALKRTEPKVVVLETYGITDFNPYELKEGKLSDQFKSFYARKNVWSKLYSMPFLFSSDNYAYAWSNTLRNHDFIFNDTAQLTKNLALIEQPVEEAKKLYLGRFVSFQTGIEDETMAKYDSLGAPVDGEKYKYSEYAEDYVQKIVDLCEEKDIELVFLTLPMYEKHIANYDTWEGTLSKLIDKKSYNWLNLQTGEGYKGFDKWAFENTYKANQHMTYSGSLHATYKLAEYLRDTLNTALPERQYDINWLTQFYGQEGYFEHYSPGETDTENIIVATDKQLKNIVLNSCVISKGKKKNYHIIAKINKNQLENIDYKKSVLQIFILINVNGQQQLANVQLRYDMFHRPKNEVLFAAQLKPLEYGEIVNGELIQVTDQQVQQVVTEEKKKVE